VVRWFTTQLVDWFGAFFLIGSTGAPPNFSYVQELHDGTLANAVIVQVLVVINMDTQLPGVADVSGVWKIAAATVYGRLYICLVAR
jgi:hypothetical protein